MSQKTTMATFRQYVLDRRDAWEAKYGLKEVELPKNFYERNLPNNLKYLDMLSQRLIRVLARSSADLETKLLTCFVYRLIPNVTIMSRYTKHQGVVDLSVVDSLGKSLDRLAMRGSARLNFRAYTPILDLARVDIDYREQYLKACVASFLYHLPKEMFYKWSTATIYSYLMSKNITGVDDFIAYQLASDFAYIGELKIRTTLIQGVPNIIKPKLKLITKKTPNLYNYNTFVYETLSWYNEQEFLSKYERLVSPNDVVQMLIGYNMCYIGKNKAQRRSKESRFHTAGDFSEKSILVTESLVKGYDKTTKALHNKIHR